MKPAPPVINTRFAIAAPERSTCKANATQKGLFPAAVACYHKLLLGRKFLKKTENLPKSNHTGRAVPKRGSGFGCLKFQMRRDSGGDIGESRAPPDRSGAHASECKDRHLFPGVVGSVPRRVTSMVCGDDQEVAGAQRFEHPGQIRIEGFERARITRHIAAMAKHRVEV